jgi:hypothetical protein
MEKESGRGGMTGPLAGVAAAACLPLAGVLAFAGQFVMSLRTGSSWATIAPGAALYLLALALVVFAPGRRAAAGAPAETGIAGTGSPGTAAGESLLAGRTEWILLALILLGGVYLRLYRIDLIPTGLNNDEAINAIEAREIAAGKPFATVTERGLNRETMFHYLAALSYRNPGLGLNVLRAMPAVFGLNPRYINDPMADAILPLRFVSIAAGTLTILLLFLFARAAFGRRVALFAALFLAVSPWHILYSRVGERVILAPVFAIAAAALFLRALRTARLADHLAWGLVTGLGFWTYTSFRAVPIALVAAAVMFARGRAGREAAGKGPGRAGPWRGLVAGAAVAAALFLGVLALSRMPPAGFLARGAYAATPPQTRWGANLLHAVTMQNYFPSRYAVIQDDAFISDGISTTFGLIGLEPDTLLLAAFATLGIACLAVAGFGRERSGGGAAAAAMVVLLIASLWLTVGWLGPSLTRMLLNLPWLCLAAAVFAVAMWDGLETLLRPLGARLGRLAGPVGAAVPAVLMAGVAVLAGAQGFSNYFLLAGRSERAMQNFGPTQTIMGMFVRSLPPDQEVIVLHTLRVDTLKYLIGDRPNVTMLTDTTKVSLEKIVSVPRTVTFVVEYARPFAEPLRSLMMRFPQADMTQVADGRVDPDKVIFYTFTIWKDAAGQIVPAPGAVPPPGGFPAPQGAPGGPEPTVPGAPPPGPPPA